MPSPLDISNIPAPRVDFIDPRTGLMSREWYRFFLNLFNLTGGGANDTSLSDLQIGPPPINEVLGELGVVYDQAQIASMMAQYEQITREIQTQFDTAPASPQLGTIASYNLDGPPIAGGVSYGTGSALAVTSAGTTGQFLTSTGAGIPIWNDVSSIAVTSFSAGTTGLTPAAATTGAITLSGTLAVANGGTGTTISTGSGSVVLGTSPTLVTPVLGSASATSVEFSLGAAATPSVTFTGDLNTGIWSPASDTVAVSTNGSERARITSAGVVLINTTSANNVRVNQKLGVASAGAGIYGGAAFTTYGGTTADICSLVDFQRSRGTTDSSFTAVANGDVLGYLTWRGADGAAFQNAAAIRAEVDGTPGLNDMPGRLVFLTTTDGTTTLSERMRISSTGAVSIQNLTASQAVFTNASKQLVSVGITGTGAVVLSTSPTLVTPLLGTPTSGNFSTGTFTWPTFNQSTTGSAATWTTARALAGNAVNGSADVAFANKFIVQGTTDAGLSGAQFLGALGTGLVKNTTTTGVLSIAAAATDYVAPSAYASANGLTMATSRLLGRTTTLSGAAEEISIAGGLTLTGGVLTGTSGTVTAVSVASANGFAGTSSGGATPALTLSTTITGVLKGNGTAISAAIAGTDYSVGTSALTTGILKSTTATGALSIAVAGDFPTLNQNTSGTAANVTGTVAIANGGTGATTRQNAMDALAGAVTSGQYLRGNGTDVVMSAIQAADVPALNQNTTGTAAGLSATLVATSGGTGQSSYTLGDTLYSSAPNTLAKLTGNITATRQFLRQTGTGTVSAAPAWDTVTKTDVGLSNVENTALSTWAGSTNITTLGTVATGTWNATAIGAAKGGTGQITYAVGDLLYASGTTALSKLADVATGNALISGGVGVAPAWGKIGLTTHVSGTLPVANGGTGQTSYTNGQLLIGNTTGNTLTKATLSAGTGVSITNGAGSVSIGLTTNYTISPSAVTVTASPFSYQNTQTYAVDVIISGGGISKLEFSRDNVVWYDTGSYHGLFNLSPNDRIRVTYVTAPTMTIIPR